MPNNGKKNHYISIAGVIGVGKTTASNLIAKELGFYLFEENVGGNAFLPLFYKEPKRWAFHSQLFYLQEKANQLFKIKSLLSQNSVIQDTPIHQDYLTYAKAQNILGNMSDEEFNLYEKFFSSLKHSLPIPDLIIQLDASLPLLQKRIENRGRDYEKNIDPSYLRTLSDLQKKWIKESTHLNIVTVDTDNLDLANNKEHQKAFIELVKAKLKTASRGGSEN